MPEARLKKTREAYRPVAQQVERLSEAQEAAGSIPARSAFDPEWVERFVRQCSEHPADGPQGDR